MGRTPFIPARINNPHHSSEHMAIGFFDSGIGGLTIYRSAAKRFPDADIIYFADQAHMPYGTRNGEQIVHLTRIGCERLFLEGCDLVVLACNTASAVALRPLQHSWLPGFRQKLGRPVNVLGIIVPTVEGITGRPWKALHTAVPDAAKPQELVGIFATQVTARSAVYEIEIRKRRTDLRVVTEPCPRLASMVERGVASGALTSAIDRHVRAMTDRAGGPPSKVILGSTHYQVVAHLFRQALSERTAFIDQPRATADALESYLARHGEYRMGTQGLRRFLTTGPLEEDHVVEACSGQPPRFERA